MDSSASRILRQLEAPHPAVADLLRLWQGRDETGAIWRRPATYLLLAKHFIDLGVPFSAREVAEAGRALPDLSGSVHNRLRHLYLLSLVRSGLLDEASRQLLAADAYADDDAFAATGAKANANAGADAGADADASADAGAEPDADTDAAARKWDEEWRGAAAAIEKQLGLRSTSPEARERHLRRALARYDAAWRSPGGTYWTGINVATLQRLLGDVEASAAAARQVEAACLEDERRQSGRSDDDPYWRFATLGEACLNQGRMADAEAWYRQAGRVARGRIGHLNSTRRQLRQLLRAIGEDALVDAWLPIPGVAVFTGHRVDEPGCVAPRFPPALEPAVRAGLRAWLERQNIRAAVCSAAQGADILFLETLQSLEGSDTRIVLPFAEDAFIRESVMNGADESWVPRFRAVLARASRLTVASHDRVGQGNTPFVYANQLILGQGLLLAEELQTSLCGLAVWRPDHERLAIASQPKPGGTADAVAQWQRCGVAVHVLDPARQEPPTLVSVPATPVDPRSDQDMPVMAMVFADVVGYSRLSDCEVGKFVDLFLGRVAQCLAHYAGVSRRPDEWLATPIPARKTWGDGLYFAFRDLRIAGQFALDLCDEVRRTRWRECGFSTDLAIRIALHAGPVHLGRDPITGLPECSGTHVSRAARLEPKTPPNQVYASDAFAALCAVEGITEFLCDYVKLLDWAKHYGTYPTYTVRRRAHGSPSGSVQRGKV